jgi:hypothetical protein
VAEDEAAVEAKREKLAKVKKDIGVLEAFYKDTNSQLGDIVRRNIGHVDWAPRISVDIQGRKYTKDIGTFEIDAARFKAQFKGNVVDLGAFCLIFLMITSSNKNNFQETSLLPGNSPTCSTLLRINGCGCSPILAVCIYLTRAIYSRAPFASRPWSMGLAPSCWIFSWEL